MPNEPIIRYGFPWWLRVLLGRGVSGITLGRRIYVRSGAIDLRRLLRHELEHIRQIERVGLVNFYARYLREYAVNRCHGLGHHAAYRAISFEAEAFAAEESEFV